MASSETSQPAHTATIVPYDEAYKEAFQALNVAWLEAYFTVEEHDWKYLLDPEGMIVEPGGEVFFVIEDGTVQGTCALIKRADDTYELAKMAVAADARGRGLGSLLLETAIAAARRKGGRRLVLVSNTTLEPAIRLYKKYGFQTTHRGPHPAYASADIAMELDLDAP